jgi:2-polyprenyl-3-methyl-5-hydroxy-6-metoxy-1,4-benzoquinol methylase
MNEAREVFWADYYNQLSQHAEPWLDYSNDRVQAQTFGLVLSALGSVLGRRCLDVGCGFGQLARALEAIGASQVTGIDVTSQFIERLRAQHPSIRWDVGTLDNPAYCSSLGSFDRISLVEVLQYVPIGPTLRRAWELLAPGGRLVAVVPNRECPIVARAMQRFPGKYLPPTPRELASVGEALCTGGGNSWGVQGMSFAEDQILSPYAISNWTRVPAFVTAPNRLLFAALKASEPSSS